MQTASRTFGPSCACTPRPCLARPRRIKIERLRVNAAQAESAFVTANGCKLHVRVSGDGSNGKPPVLMLHGFPDTGALWDKQVHEVLRTRQSCHCGLACSQRVLHCSQHPATAARATAVLDRLLCVHLPACFTPPPPRSPLCWIRSQHIRDFVGVVHEGSAIVCAAGRSSHCSRLQGDCT